MRPYLVTLALLTALAGCGRGTGQAGGATWVRDLAGGRFHVTVSAPALAAARDAGAPLPPILEAAAPRIAAALPGRWQEWVAPTLAHELDHAARTHVGPGYGSDLIAQVVSEGLADVFALGLYPRAHAPWDHALTRPAERSLWRRLEHHLTDSATYARHARWFFGSTPGIPNWAGYTLGFDLVCSYLRRHPHATPASMTGLSSTEIEANSGFRGPSRYSAPPAAGGAVGSAPSSPGRSRAR